MNDMTHAKESQVFVKIDEYKDVVDIIALTKEKIQLAKSLLQKINQIKVQEDQAIDKWNAEIADIETKINEISELLSQ